MNGRKNSQAHAASIGQNAHENGYFTVSFPLGTPTFAAKLRASNKTPGRPAQQAERPATSSAHGDRFLSNWFHRSERREPRRGAYRSILGDFPD